MTLSAQPPIVHHRSPVKTRYDGLVKGGHIERDPAQERLVRKLDLLAERLSDRRLARKGSALGWLFGRGERDASAPKGIYIWGAVGRGKTMLMDLFFEAAAIERKRRVHFHAFMADVHERIFEFRKKVKRGDVRDTDPIPEVADELAEESRLICFDEFAVIDIADAMILGRLFRALFQRGVVVVATSNVEPRRLYEGGLNRALFLPFIAELVDHMDVVALEARADFRLEKLAGAPVYHTPADATAKAALDRTFQRLAGVRQGRPARLKVKGHAVEIPEAAGGVARFSFADLCSKPYGASDYLAIADEFHTIIVENIPVMDLDRRNEARRFIILIDTFYDRHVKLIASADAEAHALYRASEGREALEFDRTVSRLIEMRSNAYLALAHGQADSAASGSTMGLVET